MPSLPPHIPPQSTPQKHAEQRTERQCLVSFTCWYVCVWWSYTINTGYIVCTSVGGAKSLVSLVTFTCWWSHTVDRPHCTLEEPYAGNHLASGKDTEKTWHNTLLVLTWVLLTTSTSVLISTERLCFWGSPKKVIGVSVTSLILLCIGISLFLRLEAAL